MVAAPPPGLRVWTHCPHCGVPLPVVPDSDPPPLFSWEVYPGLYPSIRPPPAPRRLARALPALLAVVLVSLGTVVGASLVVGGEALAPASYTVAVRVVYDSAVGPVAIVDAEVLLSDDSGTRGPQFTDSAGRAVFDGVPAGGVTLNISASGFYPLTEQMFISPVYTVPPGAPGGLVATLSPEPAGASGTTQVADYSAYPTMESFAASLLGSASVLATAAALALAGVVLSRRGRYPAVAVAGGTAGLLSPVVALYSPVFLVAPWLLFVAAAAASAGAVAFLAGIPAVVQRAPADADEAD